MVVISCRQDAYNIAIFLHYKDRLQAYNLQEIDFEGDDIDIASEGTEEVTVMTGVPPDKPVGEGTAGLTETDIKAMKVSLTKLLSSHGNY